MTSSTTEDPTQEAFEAQVLSKANEAIAIRPKRGRLTLLSRRIYNAFLFHAQQQGVERETYSVNLSELINDARFTSHNTELLKTHIRDMQATTIEWHTGGGGRQQWVSTQLLGTVMIEELGRGQPCTIKWSYPAAIRERLVKPNQYTRVLLEISSRMRSHAASVLYELGARYLTSPGRLTMREDVLWWASVLSGRSDVEKADYKILHRDVIKKALIELETLSPDFRMEVVEHRRGRKVEELQFRVVPKEQQSIEQVDAASGKNVFDLELVARIEALGFKRSDAEDLYVLTDEGQLRGAVEHVEQRLKSTTLAPLKSPAAYLRDALKKRYGVKDTAVADTSAVLPPAPSVDEKLRQLRQDWESTQAAKAMAEFGSRTDEQKKELTDAFESHQLPSLATPIVKAWRKDGVNSRIASSSFYRWLAATLWPEEVTDKALLEFAMSR